MIYDQTKPIENSIQLVMPSNAQLIAKQLSLLSKERIVIAGELMAGEPWHKVVYSLCKANPGKVIMSTTSARSLRYNLNQVREKQVTTVEDKDISQYGSPDIITKDVQWDRLKVILESSGINIESIEAILLCAQDHGEPFDLNRSMRDFRMKTVYQPLSKNGKLEDLLMVLDEIPNHLPRLQSLGASAHNTFPNLPTSKIFVMDSSPAVILGTLNVEKFQELVVNVGNGHTIAMIVENGLVQAAYEQHTGGVEPNDFLNDLKLVSALELTHEVSLAKGGHGIFYNKNFRGIEFKKLLPFSLIGPNREKLSMLKTEKKHPGGSMMMAGPIGLIRAYQKIRESK